MEPAPAELVFIQIGMPPPALVVLRSAADRAGMPIEDWLVRLLVDGVAKAHKRSRV
jgi:hypothetical protein